MILIPVCERCSSNEEEFYKIREELDSMWNSLIASASSQKEKRYYTNCKNISKEQHSLNCSLRRKNANNSWR